jgi:hypothetical protein
VNIDAWLDARSPAPPAELRDRIGGMVGQVPDGNDPAIACLAAAERALQRLVTSGDSSRAAALDLLAIDALVTYAFEAAADDGDAIPARAADAMAALSRVAAR